MTRQWQTTLEASGIEWPALGNYIPCMAHVIKLALGAFLSSVGVKDHTRSWKAHEGDQQFGENESTDIGNSQRLQKEGNARIHNVSALRPGLAKIIENVCFSTHFESAETDLHKAENAFWIDYTDTWSSKRIHWLSKTKVRNTVLSIMDVMTHWNSILELLEQAYQIHEFTHQWLVNAKYSNYQPLFTTQDEWTIVKYVTKVLWPFWYWTMCMSKRHTVTLHHVTTVYNDLFDHLDGVMQALAKMMTPL